MSTTINQINGVEEKDKKKNTQYDRKTKKHGFSQEVENNKKVEKR